MKRLVVGLFAALALMIAGAAAWSLLISPAAKAQSPAPALTDWQVVDLTQPLTLNRISIGEHSGTHWGTPNTFIEGARSADMIPAQELVVPAVVIDIRDKAAEDVDYRLSVDDITAWEAVNGQIPAGSVVILFTGWEDKWDDPDAFINEDADGILHWPGFGADAAEYLVSERGAVGLGTDTHGADPGNDEEYGASFAMYDADGMILECLGGLDQLPPVGATLVVGGWPTEGGSGSPARIFAFLPPAE
jgi:kynurenine formamidase